MHLTSFQKRALTWCLIAAAAWWVLWRLTPVLQPFVIAAVLAYALSPLVDRLHRWCGRRVPRVLWVLFVQILFLLALLCTLLLVVTVVAKQLPLLRQQIPVLINKLGTGVTPWLGQFGVHIRLDLSSLQAMALDYLSANFEDLSGSLLAYLKDGGNVVLILLGNALLIPVVLFYLLMDWHEVVTRVVELVPPRWRQAFDGFVDEVDLILGQYLRGQLLVMGVLAGFYSIGLSLFGLDLAVPIGVFTGLAVFVPYLGFGLGLVLALVAGLLEFASFNAVIMVAVVYGFGQFIESFYLTPRLVGKRLGLHPLAVIFALLAFGQLLGFVGVLLALPLSAVLLVAMRRVRTSYMNSRLYRYQA